MKISLITLFLLLFIPNFGNNLENVTVSPKEDAAETSLSLKYSSIYEELDLNSEISFQAFYQAMIGYEKLNKKKKPLLTIIDFSKPSTKERFYVINIEKKKVLYKSVVAHGKKSGGNYATSFSNKVGSDQSSLGFFLTGQTYKGKNGLSLIINGLEKGINDNVKRRSVVIHGADYANPALLKSAGRLGRSFGCPALPHAINNAVIETIKDGSVIYAFSQSYNNDYLKRSSIVTQAL